MEKMGLDYNKVSQNHAGNDLPDEFELTQLPHFIDIDTEVSESI